MRRIKSFCKLCLFKSIYNLFCLFPLKNVVVGSSFYGMRYENNPRFVFDLLEEKYPKIKKKWICNKNNKIKLPEYVVPIYGKINMLYSYATSKVWIDSHFFPYYVKKRKGQLSIFMYHGGIGIKRNSNEVLSREKTPIPKHSANNTTISISNSLFMNKVNRTSLEYEGPILKCGYPKNDLLFSDPQKYREKVCSYYGLPMNKKIVMYAPTYRQDKTDVSCYHVDFDRVCQALTSKFGGDWIVIVRWHPHQSFLIEHTEELYGKTVIDATYYANMQELIIASDLFISDYSSCIFEAAERKIPCISYVTDWDVFKAEQGVHFEIDRLPFPYCKNNDELIKAINNFDQFKYEKQLSQFFSEQGLYESGKASECIADIIATFLSGDTDIINRLEYEDC